MGKLLDLKMDIDHRLLSLVNYWRKINTLALSREQLTKLKQTESLIKNLKVDKILVCGNGPSLNELDFKDFSGTPAIVANYFYKHPDAALLNPQYYVIIDGKIASGVWPITMIDEILSKFPNVILFLDIRWYHLAVFEKYVDNTSIRWILPSLFPHAFSKPKLRISQPLCGLNVVATSIGIATSLGYKNIGIAGVDGDGLFREILDKPSHFYEGSKDISMNSFESMVKSLILSAENLWAWYGIVKNHRESGIRIVNLCYGGIMDCMDRVRPKDFLHK